MLPNRVTFLHRLSRMLHRTHSVFVAAICPLPVLLHGALVGASRTLAIGTALTRQYTVAAACRCGSGVDTSEVATGM